MNARRTFAGVLVLPLLFGLSAIPGTPSVEAANQPPGSESAYGAVNADWWSTVQQDIRRSEYYITWQEQTYLADVPAAHQAPNRAHNLRTYFTPGGPVVIPRVWTEETDAPPWRWEVRLVAWGRDGALQSVSPAALEVQDNRIEYLRDGLVEWYRNGEEGLEQGFTLLAAPEGGQPGDALQLDLALGGDLVPELVQDGVELQLRAQGTDAGLRYSGLWAVDAIGESLPAWLEMQGSNLSIRIEDVGAAYPIEVAPIITGLPTSYDWATTFGQSGAEFATSVATAGDVDGDGYSEVIVGAPNYDSGLVDQGGVFVYYGSSGGLYEWSDWYKIGDQGGAHYGHSVATAGDVNGDGYADVIVGAPYYTNGTGQEGEGGTWVYHGSDEGLEDDWSTHDEGNQAGAAFGQSVGTAGDVNGDGYADVIVGAPLYNNGESEEGMVWVWHGSEGGLSNSHNWHAEANQAYASFGQSVSTAGDINRDGYADIIVGASRYTDGEYWEGAAFVWLGSAGGINGGVDGTPANEHRHLQINQDSARFGWAVSTAGDVNGDGYADVIVGAPYYTSGEGREGGAWLYLGSSGGLNATAANQDEGNQADAHFGWSVATAGDVNGDGRADVVVGAPDYGTNDAGRAWVWHGQPTSAGISTTRDWDAGGEQADAFFGKSVATAGDVDGDGFSDVIVGAPGHSSAAGRAYVYHGGPGPLAEEAGWTKPSNQANALFGFSVGAAGDVNGDGYADVIVGAPRWDGGQENEGAAWVYLGQATGLTSAPHWYRRSGLAGADFGASVGTAGDVNGDGYDDVIVGAPLWHNPETEEGAAFVYAGSSTGLSETAAPLWSKPSDQVGAKFGTSVGTAGDVNGDGYADIIVGAPFWQSGGLERGGVWLYYGSPTGTHSAPDWYKVGDQEEAQYGYAVGTAGDVDGDGYSDVIVGSPYWEDEAPNVNEGRAWVYLGSSGGLRHDLHWHAESNNYIGQLGHSVGTAGDVDGDGYSDVIVGSPYWEDEAPNVNEGRAWVYLGSSGGLRHDLHWHAESNNYIGQLGHSVGTAGDVDGDGYSDVIVGAPGFGDGGLTQEGKVWVFQGSSAGLESSSSWSREGGQNSAHYGWSVGTAGDVNGDGYADVIIGVELWNGGLSNEGRASVYHGSFDGLETSPSWYGEGDQASAHYGTSVGTAGDVNGDGYADVIVGAPNYNKNLADEGQAFLYYGNGGPGVSLRLAQFKSSGAPLARLGHSDINRFRLGVRYANPFGRGKLQMEIETKLLSQRFTGSGTFIPGGSGGWSDAIPGNGTTMSSGTLLFGMPYHWRMRFRYHPGTTPFMPASRWVTVPWNGWNEQDLRTSGARILLPLSLRGYDG